MLARSRTRYTWVESAILLDTADIDRRPSNLITPNHIPLRRASYLRTISSSIHHLIHLNVYSASFTSSTRRRAGSSVLPAKYPERIDVVHSVSSTHPTLLNPGLPSVSRHHRTSSSSSPFATHYLVDKHYPGPNGPFAGHLRGTTEDGGRVEGRSHELELGQAWERSG
jgi:hypothetical protein